MELVRCVNCDEGKSRDEYSKAPRKLNGLNSWCKGCCREADRLRKAADPEARRWKQIKRLYGLSKESFMALWNAQSGSCRICGEVLSLDAKGGFATDHNHATGTVRGLLCKTCNHGLGLFKDSPSVLESALAYLKEKGHYGQGDGGTKAAI